MTPERKDVRAKLDPEIHEALVKICERDHMEIGEIVEREMVKFVMGELHNYMLSRSKLESIPLLGKLRERRGKGHF